MRLFACTSSMKENGNNNNNNVQLNAIKNSCQSMKKCNKLKQMLTVAIKQTYKRLLSCIIYHILQHKIQQLVCKTGDVWLPKKIEGLWNHLEVGSDLLHYLKKTYQSARFIILVHLFPYELAIVCNIPSLVMSMVFREEWVHTYHMVFTDLICSFNTLEFLKIP